MSNALIQDNDGNDIALSARRVCCWEDAPDAKCLVSFCTPDTREIELVALRSGDTFSYDEWNGGEVVKKSYRCVRGLADEP